MRKPRKTTKDMVLCAECKKPIHIDDLGLISKEGLFHKGCFFSITYQKPSGFLTGYEARIRKTAFKEKTSK